MAVEKLPPEKIKELRKRGFLKNKPGDPQTFSARVITGNGTLSAEQAICVAEAAKKYGDGTVTFTTRLTVECPGIDYENVEGFCDYIARKGLQTGGTGAKVRPVVSCKGTVCPFGMIDTFGLAETAHQRFFEGYADVAVPHKFKIAFGGCQNNCAKVNLNDVGVMGHRVKNESGQLIPAYKVFLGGRWGRQGEVGKQISEILTSEQQMFDVIESTLLYYIEYGEGRERLCETLDRMGYEQAEREILSGKLLECKREILKNNKH